MHRGLGLRLSAGAAGVVALALVCAIGVPAWAAKSKSAKPALSISVLSGRANLVTGGSALVAVNVPRRDRRKVKITLGHRNLTRKFVAESNGQLEALVTGLALGSNTLQATVPGGWATKITLVDHPNTGPIFAGPQLEPWICEAGATDPHCDKPTTFSYLYMSTNPADSGFQTYNPAAPPSDVAETTTDTSTRSPSSISRASRGRR
jgi:hypothetical protein